MKLNPKYILDRNKYCKRGSPFFEYEGKKIYVDDYYTPGLYYDYHNDN
jgi:hypothetical protein